MEQTVLLRRLVTILVCRGARLTYIIFPALGGAEPQHASTTMAVVSSDYH